MLKDNKGITLASLVITIIILFILSSVATVSGIETIKYIKFKNAKAQFEMMQSHVNSWYEESKSNTDVFDYGEDLSVVDVTMLSTTINLGTGQDDTTGYRYFSANYIKENLNIDGISNDFLINIKERSVLLLGGFTHYDKTYYSARDFEISNIGYEEVSGNIDFETEIEYREKDTYIIVSDITIPEGINKYEVKYKIEGEDYWTTVISDRKELKDNKVCWAIPIINGLNYTIKFSTASSQVTSKEDKITTKTFKEYIDVYYDQNIDDDSEFEKVIKDKTVNLKFVDKNGDIITIPRTFNLAMNTEGRVLEDEVRNGIVVVAPDGSEFVWVPVKNANTMYGTNKDGNKLGKLYTFTTEGATPRNWTEERGVMRWLKTSGESTANREPDYLKATNDGGDAVPDNESAGLHLLSSIIGIPGTVGIDNDAMLNTWSTQLQNEFNEMIEGVEKNYGFYIGRYETSLREETNENDEAIKIVQSIKNIKSASAGTNYGNRWYGLYQVEKEYSKKNSFTDIVGSSMIWGSQYDQMMIWMQNNGIDVTFDPPEEGVPKEELLHNNTFETGSKETDKLNNIYDLWGNKYEWTLEATYASRRVARRRFFRCWKATCYTCN